MKISAIVNTYNESEAIGRCLASLAWVDELIVVDNASEDNTQELAKKFTPHVYTYETHHGFVEPVRNFAIAKAQGDWLLIVDADEEVPPSLADKLRALAETDTATAWYELPRKNLIFQKWFEGAGWWPDYNIRYFKKGAVTWSNEIHRPPKTEGKGDKLPQYEEYAIIHHHYVSVSQFILRMDRYTTIQAEELMDKGYVFSWPDILQKPLSEFLTRFFVWEGYKVGLHGLVLSLLQAASFLIMYLKVWEKQGFKKVDSDDFLSNVTNEASTMAKEWSHWEEKSLAKTSVKSKIKKLLSR